MTPPTEPLYREVHERLGYRPLNRAWAQGEIALGLVTAAIGLLLGVGAVVQPLADLPWHLAGLGVLVFVLGAYLALAGQRSLLYQSQNRQAALLIEEIRRQQDSTQVVAPRK